MRTEFIKNEKDNYIFEIDEKNQNFSLEDFYKEFLKINSKI